MKAYRINKKTDNIQTLFHVVTLNSSRTGGQVVDSVLMMTTWENPMPLNEMMEKEIAYLKDKDNNLEKWSWISNSDIKIPRNLKASIWMVTWNVLFHN